MILAGLRMVITGTGVVFLGAGMILAGLRMVITGTSADLFHHL